MTNITANLQTSGLGWKNPNIVSKLTITLFETYNIKVLITNCTTV